VIEVVSIRLRRTEAQWLCCPAKRDSRHSYYTKDQIMLPLNEKDILTKISRYNLIRNERLIYIDVHETKAGKLAGKFVAVPNLVNIIAKQEFQGTGETEAKALENCLQKIKDFQIEDLFPKKE
jgi:hypothetical protein